MRDVYIFRDEEDQLAAGVAVWELYGHWILLCFSGTAPHGTSPFCLNVERQHHHQKRAGYCPRPLGPAGLFGLPANHNCAAMVSVHGWSRYCWDRGIGALRRTLAILFSSHASAFM